MEENPFVKATQALASTGRPYCIAGGFAVVMHGGNRFTPDINVAVPFNQAAVNDLAQSLESAGLVRDESELALHQLYDVAESAGTSGLAPASEVSPAADRVKRFVWFRDAAGGPFGVSFFGWHPIPFEDLIRSKVDLSTGTFKISVTSLAHLQEMKLTASRPQDHADLESLGLVEQVRALESGAGIGPDEVKRRLKGVIDDDARLENLITFMDLPVGEKLDWLGQMLTMLGQFL